MKNKKNNSPDTSLGQPLSELLSSERREYRAGGEVHSTLSDPLQKLEGWLSDARDAGVPEWNAMCLATVDSDGRPSVRIVLLKSLRADGLVFFTNYRSRKGRELEANPHVALTAWWPQLARQVRIEGRAARISTAESDAYFQNRPRGSRLSAVASPQSQVIGSYQELEEHLATMQKRYGNDRDIPRPAHWGGYVVTPCAVEFWQGRPNRLHERLVYHLQADGTWKTTCLAP